MHEIRFYSQMVKRMTRRGTCRNLDYGVIISCPDGKNLTVHMKSGTGKNSNVYHLKKKWNKWSFTGVLKFVEKLDGYGKIDSEVQKQWMLKCAFKTVDWKDLVDMSQIKAVRYVEDGGKKANKRNNITSGVTYVFNKDDDCYEMTIVDDFGDDVKIPVRELYPIFEYREV